MPRTVIRPPFRTSLVAAIGDPVLAALRLLLATRAAVALPAVAARADEEHKLAMLETAKPLPQNHFRVRRHACSQASLDNDSAFVAG